MLQLYLLLYIIAIQGLKPCTEQCFNPCTSLQKMCTDWECNSVDRTQVGVFLEGGNTMSLRGTVFNNHNIGLHYTSNAVNSPQDHAGNRWVPGGMVFPVQNDNANVGSQQSSAFIINPTAANLVPSNAFLFPQWIRLIGTNTNYDCNNPLQLTCGTVVLPLLAPPSPSINALDIAVANNTFATATHTATAEYLGKRRLFRKLSENPSLAQVDPSLPPFVPSNQGGCIGHFDNIQKGIEQAFAISSADSITIDTFQKQCTYYLDSLHCLDSMLYANYDTITRNLRTALATDFGNIMQQHQAFLTVLNTNQQNALMPIQTANIGFTTYALHEDLEKQVNDIYLQTLALGIAEFTPVQITTLETIAAYCPQEGGAAVHQARGMLSMFQDVNMLDFDCNGSHARKAVTNDSFTATVEWEVILFPNPTSHELTIQSNLAFESNASIEIFNALGQLIKTKLVTAETNNITIDASSLLDGIYIMRLKNGENTVTKSFVVSK